LRKYKGNRKLISFEPLLGRLPKQVSLRGMDWIVLGALTGSYRRTIGITEELEKEWAMGIIRRCKQLSIRYFMKPSLKGFTSYVQKYPKATVQA